MSKYSEAMENDLNAIKKATKDIIKKGGDLAFEKYHEAKSLIKLKDRLRRGI